MAKKVFFYFWELTFVLKPSPLQVSGWQFWRIWLLDSLLKWSTEPKDMPKPSVDDEDLFCFELLHIK
jgi:hypothetical protein